MLKTMYKPVSPMCCNCYVLQPRVDPNTPGIRVSILETHTQYPTLRHETWQLTTCPCHFEMKKWRPKSPQSRKWRQTSFVPLQKTIALRVLSEKMKVSSETSSQKKNFLREFSAFSSSEKLLSAANAILHIRKWRKCRRHCTNVKYLYPHHKEKNGKID